MKCRPVLLITMVLALCGYAYGQVFTGDGFKQTVVNSDHDLRPNSTGGTLVCEYCHTPHKAGGGETPLLWNVTLHTGPFQPYRGSATFNATDIRDVSTASNSNSAAYMSLLCLSCHDGAITQASFYETWNDPDFTGTLGTNISATPPDIGESGTVGLTNDHPVDFTYSAALATADGGLKTPTEGAGVRIPYVGAPGNLFPLYKDQSGDTSGRVECATCHNPHNDTVMPFLRMDNTGSALCLNCHGS